MSHLDRAARDENVLLVDVKVHMRDGGQVGRAPFVKVSDELEGEVGQLVTVCGQDEGARGRQTQRRPVEGPEDPAPGHHAVLGAPRKAAAYAVPEGALLLGLAASRVALDQVPTDALAAFGAVTVPEQLFGLEHLGQTQS